ncbi:hypothetical protein [Roseospira goensis]|uniref:Copper chaperone PCu(A)C n=1 Tax=Roseospira goensis TaxID=391922 RepID=A0A7W6RXU9_9PROT|nr:hypothetical protein [Roseospira goensis]MBB4284725.1 hypothetical protein [Roseospira goensis]
MAGRAALGGAMLVAVAGGAPATAAADANAEARAAVARAADSVTAGRPAAAVEALREAMLTVWSAAPFDLVRVEATTATAEGFRAYAPRPDGPYTAGEPLHLYVEPIGLEYEFADGLYTMGLKADFLVLDTDGTILGGQRDFAHVPFTFHVPSTAVFMTMSLGTERLPAGDYVIQLTVRDALGGGAATREVPFSVAAP